LCGIHFFKLFYSALCHFLSLFTFSSSHTRISDHQIECVKSSRRGKVEKNIRILKLLHCWDTYRIEIQKDTDTVLKILLSRDTKYRFVSLSICIVSNYKIRIVNRKILTSMILPAHSIVYTKLILFLYLFRS
jgi:hypothetical protein